MPRWLPSAAAAAAGWRLARNKCTNLPDTSPSYVVLLRGGRWVSKNTPSCKSITLWQGASLGLGAREDFWLMLASLWYSSYHHMPAVYYTHLSLCWCNWRARCECQHNSSVKTDEWHDVHRNAYKCKVLTDKLFARLLRINTAVHRTSSLITLTAHAQIHREVKRNHMSIIWLTWSKLASYQYGVFRAQKSHNAYSTVPVFKSCKIKSHTLEKRYTLRAPRPPLGARMRWDGADPACLINSSRRKLV